MPGANCAFHECAVTRRKSFSRKQYLQFQTGQTFYAKWRKDILNVLLKYHKIDANFRESLKNGKVS